MLRILFWKRMYLDLILTFLLFSLFLLFFAQFKFKENVKCQGVCTKTYTKGDKEGASKLDFLKMGMQLNYQHHWSVKHKLYICYSFCLTVLSLLTSNSMQQTHDSANPSFWKPFCDSPGLLTICLWHGAMMWKKIRNTVTQASQLDALLQQMAELKMLVL